MSKSTETKIADVNATDATPQVTDPKDVATELVDGGKNKKRPTYTQLVAEDSPIAILKGCALVEYLPGARPVPFIPADKMPTDFVAGLALCAGLNDAGLKAPTPFKDGYITFYTGTETKKSGGREAQNLSPEDYLAQAKDDVETLGVILAMEGIGASLALAKGKLDVMIRDYETVMENGGLVTIASLNAEIVRVKRVRQKESATPSA